MKKTMTAMTGALLFAGAGTAHAVIPLFDVDASASYWNASPSGDVQSGDTLDLEDDLDYSSEGHNVLALRVAHPVPLIPNFRIRHTDMDYSATGDVQVDNFEGNDYSGEVRSELDLSHFDYTLFYTPPIPFVTADLGFNFKHFDGSFDIEERNGSGNSDSISINEILPMLHAHGRVDLPLTGLGAGAEINYIAFDGDSIRDIEAYLSYSYNLFYAQGGYREFGVDVEASGDLQVDASMGGPFLRLGVSF